jgi:hypothetical protein
VDKSVLTVEGQHAQMLIGENRKVGPPLSGDELTTRRARPMRPITAIDCDAKQTAAGDSVVKCYLFN